MSRNLLKHCIGPAAALFVLGLLAACSPKMKDEATIKEALKNMEADALKLGEPRLVADSLFFGTTKMNSNYGIVDSITAKYGCTATFFVKKGDAFVRISTDVMQEGHRAIGTDLDPNGPAIKAVREGKPYYGFADILGNPYETGYDPIETKDGEIIGVYYVGFQIER